MRPPRLCLLAVSMVVVALSRAASFDERVEALFRPLQGEMVALSPDGQRVAYAVQNGRELGIVMASVEPPGPKKTISVEPLPDPGTVEEPPPARLRFMRWATPSRLVYAPFPRVVPLPPLLDANGRAAPNPDGPTVLSPILAVDADGRQRGVLVDAHHFQETLAEARRSLADLLRTTKELVATRNEAVRWRMPHLDILGFLPRDREQLVIRTHGAYSVPMQRLVDIRTASVREFGDDWPAPPGEPQVFDWYRLRVVGERKEAAQPATLWRDEELGGVQRVLEAKFPRRIVELLDWSETRARVLFRVTGGSDPGRIFVYQRSEDIVLEILSCAPWLGSAKLHETRFFHFAVPDGARLSGYVTWPAKPAGTRAPVLVVFPSGFPGRAQAAFDPEAQALADLGFAVVRLNHRGVAGVRAEDLGALRAAVDRVSIDDARLALEWIAARNPERSFDRSRSAALGRGFGGYLALRALELEPAVFRCALAIDAPADLRAWLRPEAGGAAPDIPAALIDHAGTDWRKLSVVDQAEALARPVLLLVEPGRSRAIDESTAALRSRLQALARPADYHELDAGFAAGRAASRAAVYRVIHDFLARQFAGYDVKIGPVEEVR